MAGRIPGLQNTMKLYFAFSIAAFRDRNAVKLLREIILKGVLLLYLFHEVDAIFEQV